MTPAPLDGEARASQLRRTVEVVAAAMLPRRLPTAAARSLVPPALVALSAVAAATTLGLVVAVEIAVAAWGSAVVAAVAILVALVAPAARLSLSAPPSIARALTRSAPLLRALDLGPALARHWTAAAAVPTLLSGAALSGATALVLGLRGEPGTALAIVVAAAAGALVAVAIARRGGRRVAERGRSAGPRAMAARRLAAIGALACLVSAVASPDLAVTPTAAAGAGVAAAVWVAGDALALDARPWLRLQATLVDCGATPAAIVGRSAALGLAATAALGAMIGVAASAVAGVDAGIRIGLAAGAVGVGALAVLVLEPDARAAAQRCLAFALAIAPTVGALIAGAPVAWIVGAAALAGATALVALARRLP
ncbi:hypothetical protein [Agrococcus citreus]|uniref:Uncharacterized protein n=1 Tax=Agrococcus citreus TaxID=84643 RepID=A0ABN1YTA7_9MICO